MHIAEVVTIAKSLPLLRLNTYKSLILSYSADYRRILQKNLVYYLRLFNIDKADSSQYFIVSFKVCIGVSSTDIRSVTDFIYE
jgi:hypothetical protein